jgi:2-polyprenyl-6-methoxyphenol hydroxylase-like FAD-dependent oxidoreductase
LVKPPLPSRRVAGEAQIETDVAIVGGGPTGLALAVELGLRGVRSGVLEPRTPLEHTRPRAKTTSVRTMEHFRRWGRAGPVREAAHLPVGWSDEIVFCVSLLGPEVTSFDLTTDRVAEYAETSQQIAQPLVEQVLRDAARDLEACSVEYGWRGETVAPRDSGACVVAINGAGSRREIAAAFVVGCDGAGGITRRAIGADYVGESHPRPNLTVVFRSPGLSATPRSTTSSAPGGPWRDGP